MPSSFLAFSRHRKTKEPVRIIRKMMHIPFCSCCVKLEFLSECSFVMMYHYFKLRQSRSWPMAWHGAPCEIGMQLV
jgi:hypothetical protein